MSVNPDANQMSGIQHDDPLLWTVEQVADELCTPSSPWIQDSTTLKEKLLEEEVDGQTLLTYEFLYSRKELMQCLGIKTARRQTALAHTILNLQAKSQAFRLWKKNFKSLLVDIYDDEKTDEPAKLPEVLMHQKTPEKSPPGLIADSLPSPNQSEARGGIEQVDHDDSRGNPGSLPQDDLPSGDSFPHGEAVPSVVPDTLTKNTSLESSNHDISVAVPASVDEKLAKRKRVAPMNLSAQPATTAEDPNSIYPENSYFLQAAVGGYQDSATNQTVAQDIPLQYAYLGSHRFRILNAKSPDLPLMKLQGQDFAATSLQSLPIGQRLLTGRSLKKLFMANSRKESLLKRGIAYMRSPSPSEESESIFQLDDLPDYWDEETMKEMAEEEAETLARDRELARRVSQDRVEEILKEEIENIKVRWTEKKLPKYERKAYKFWTDARRRQETKMRIIDAQQHAEFYDRRTRALCTEILKDIWHKEQDVIAQARILDQNVEDKLYHLWLIGLLESRDQPPKPKNTQLHKTPKQPLVVMDDEVLTSSDEDDFIVADEDDGSLPQHHLEYDSDSEPALARRSSDIEAALPDQGRSESPASPQKDPSMYVDLTQLESPEKLPDSEATRVYIDLTSPIKPKDETVKAPMPVQTSETPFGDAPPIEELESFQIIGQSTVKFWAKLKDRWRLIICLVWKLSQKRRQWLLRVVEDNTVEDAWKASIQRHLSRPLKKASQLEKEEAQTAAFDLTRIFLSFIRCRHCKEDQAMALDKKDKSRLFLGQKDLFPPFYSFLRAISPHFPKDSQIFRTDAFDEEIALEDDDGLPAEVSRTPSKIRRVQEIVQDKVGVDLRERENRRAEEQEARRLKLRATLATTDSMTMDKSRLIINESKQDDQSFIYVNDDIGTRIKDHQINGVRFLWNQIILDTQERQGCLLAHTMGLGKTMQIITFLVAITEAAASDDPSVRCQIPEDLRSSQTLVLCPAGLVDNWIDEILRWAPKGVLRPLLKIEAAQKDEASRLSVITDWDQQGGVLVIGYEMFRRIRGTHPNMAAILTDKPSLVIADEAHALKNPDSEIHKACNMFRTTRRIALTGSPLANSVQEYYSMINWIAPNFLGPVAEFQEIYAKPIQDGLYLDSTAYDRKKALKMLEVLKMTVAPKVQRATIDCVRQDLPPKSEFILFVEPTPMQKRLYNLYMNTIITEALATGGVFNYLNDLGLVCNHPRCFRQKTQDMRKKLAGSQPRLSEVDEESSAGEGKKSAFPESIISAVLKETNDPDINNPNLSRKVELLILILDAARQVKDKVLIFSQSIPTLDYLENLFHLQKRLVCRLDGSTVVNKRLDMIKNFNTGNQEIYLISTKAGGVGLNIQGANRVVIFDFKWNPMVDQQAIGRAYRFGQEKKVFVYRFVVAGTFEEQLQNKAVFKMQLSSRVVDEKNPISWGKRLTNLLQPVEPTPARDLSPFLNRDHILDNLIHYDENGGMIRHIVSTETFEEEDSTNELTAEEKKDAKNLHALERLRYTDREKFDKLMGEKLMADQIRAMAQAANPPRPSSSQPAPTISPNPTFSDVNRSMDGTSDLPFIGRPQPVPRPTTQSPINDMPEGQGVTLQRSGPPPSTAPLPMAGANTYFGTATEPAAAGRPAPITTAPNFFSPPQSQARDDFQYKLAAAAQKLVSSGRWRIQGTSDDMAENITATIETLRKEKSLGFLPDHQRWKLLLSMVTAHDRFVPALVSNFWTPGFLALASAEHIQQRTLVLNGLSEEQFEAQLVQRMNDPDPQNLHNISRLNAQSARGLEDMRVMQEAAEKRQRRNFRLPQWANEALAENRGETS